MMEKECVVYRTEKDVPIQVIVEDETVWLTQNQLVELFQTSKSNISEHIRNIFIEGELEEFSVVRDFRTTASDGKTYKVKHYNLDVIISVGYRVKSVVGVAFRKWATQVLKQYMLQGYAINRRFRDIEFDVESLKHQVTDIVQIIHKTLPPSEGLFFNGQIYDAFECVRGIIKTAKKSILLIDNYVDESVLTMMADKAAGVSVAIYTAKIPQPLRLAEAKFNAQYGGLALKTTATFHDRFLIIDDDKIYLVGASLKDLGRKWFGFTEMDSSNIARIKKAL